MNRRTFEEMVSYFNQTVADMDINRKYKMELLGMITAILQRHDEDMKHAPTIERKTGKWEQDNPFTKPRCSECGEPCFGLHGFDYTLTPYCPNCGSKMR